MKKLFTEHPATVNQTYIEHAKFSLCLGYSGFKMMVAGVIHAIFPFVLKDTASKAALRCCENICKREEDLNLTVHS